jgi:hypothetical protein
MWLSGREHAMPSMARGPRFHPKHKTKQNKKERKKENLFYSLSDNFSFLFFSCC